MLVACFVDVRGRIFTLPEGVLCNRACNGVSPIGSGRPHFIDGASVETHRIERFIYSGRIALVPKDDDSIGVRDRYELQVTHRLIRAVKWLTSAESPMGDSVLLSRSYAGLGRETGGISMRSGDASLDGVPG